MLSHSFLLNLRSRVIELVIPAYACEISLLRMFFSFVFQLSIYPSELQIVEKHSDYRLSTVVSVIIPFL